MEELNINFKINNDILKLSIDSVEMDLYEKLKNDDAYTTQYIKLLVRNGLYVINDKDKEIREIYRITGNKEEMIYHANLGQIDDQSDKENNANDLSQDCSQKSTDYWTDAATSFILDKYEAYLSDIGPMKKFKTKKLMWSQISTDMMKMLNISKTSVQIENRYKTVLKRKKKAVENNCKSGSSREKVSFEEKLRKIAHFDDSIEPEVLRSATGVKYPKLNVEIPEEICNTSLVKHSIDGSPKAKKSKRTNEDLRVEMFKEKEAAKERRHKEKLDLIRELFGKPNIE